MLEIFFNTFSQQRKGKRKNFEQGLFQNVSPNHPQL